MKSLEITIGKPEGKPVTITIRGMHKDYSEVQLYYPKDEEGRPLIAPKKQWYVYYSYRNPFTGFMQRIKDYCGLNSYKTAAERLEAGKAWIKAYELLLDNGFNPFDAKGIEDKDMPKDIAESVYTVRSGLKYAYDNNLGSWKPSTAEGFATRMNVFLEYAKLNRFDHIDIRELKDTHIIGFLNWLINPKGRNVGRTSQDNYKRAISGLLGKLKKDRIISANPASGIETKKDRPQKNKPFTPEEVKKLSEYMLQHDRKLYEFVMLIIYTFLRESEIIRLRVKDIHVEQGFLYADTKGDSQAIKKMIDPICRMFAKKNLAAFPEEAHIFTNTGEIEIWDAKEKSKVDHFGNRFKKVKRALGFGKDYGLYSFRHSAALDLYFSHVRQGFNDHESVLKVMPIIGHQDPETTRNYLRDIGGMIPKDYTDLYTLEF
ncbi:tyrosine-type recombinase/integrase [Flavobacterium lindanitolerans]|uniref:tyrosine-type recombinase/integrase n=1 Tax=Flavobacterium lindanitolerans TaxID=428988 RepID=UPI0023EFAFAA|nr:tyrosine-type recombinase/integrase [Flavobacterium lindanitolerans]